MEHMPVYFDGEPPKQTVPSLENPLYKVSEVATMFSVSEATIRQWIRDKTIGAVKINGQWRIEKKEVVRIANEEYGSD